MESSHDQRKATVPLPDESNLSASTISWRVFAGAEGINASAQFNFRENVPPEAFDIVQGIAEAHSMRALYIPLLVMPEDDSLLVSLLDSLSTGKLAIPTAYDPVDITRILISRANAYLPVAIHTMEDRFFALGYADKEALPMEAHPNLPSDDRIRSAVRGWCEIFSKMSETTAPASLMQREYDEAGMGYVIDALLAGVPEEDLLA